jgi:hypothetical protein
VVKIVPGAPDVTHLLFVDDNILFCRANKEETANLKDVNLPIK